MLNSLSVAGKKGKMLERRILKDFQIGFVESIVNEAIKHTDTRDVFTTIAKAMNKTRSKKYGKCLMKFARYKFIICI